MSQQVWVYYRKCSSEPDDGEKRQMERWEFDDGDVVEEKAVEDMGWCSYGCRMKGERRRRRGSWDWDWDWDWDMEANGFSKGYLCEESGCWLGAVQAPHWLEETPCNFNMLFNPCGWNVDGMLCFLLYLLSLTCVMLGIRSKY